MYNTTVRTVWWRNPLMCCCIKTHTVPKIIWISQSLSRLEQLFQCQIYVHKGQTYTVAYAPAVTDLVFAQRIRSFLGHCGLRFRRLSIGSEYSEVTKKNTHILFTVHKTQTVQYVQYVLYNMYVLYTSLYMIIWWEYCSGLLMPNYLIA